MHPLPHPSLSPAAHLKLRLMSWNDGQALQAKVRQGCVGAGAAAPPPPASAPNRPCAANRQQWTACCQALDLPMTGSWP